MIPVMLDHEHFCGVRVSPIARSNDETSNVLRCVTEVTGGKLNPDVVVCSNQNTALRI